jgi:predicted ATPase with chaperone activity
MPELSRIRLRECRDALSNQMALGDLLTPMGLRPSLSQGPRHARSVRPSHRPRRGSRGQAFATHLPEADQETLVPSFDPLTASSAHAGAFPIPASAAQVDDPQGPARDAMLARQSPQGQRPVAGENDRPTDKGNLPSSADAAEPFVPLAPSSLEEAELANHDVEALALRYLFTNGAATGRQIADQIGLPFGLIQEFLLHLKVERLVTHRATSRVNDYVYELTDLGRDRVRAHAERSTYFGTAPVSLCDYVAGVAAQSVRDQRPSIADLCRAFSDLRLSVEMIGLVGQAVHAGNGLFLYGAPGNGKTSIAQRITRAFRDGIWIPRAIGASGEIVRLFDPSNHEVLPNPEPDGLLSETQIDRRWVWIRRPTIIVGGELAMDNLEITNNTVTGTSEAPLQLKANGGTLVIDDFGRQKMSTRELLNRWIIPLENGYDFLELASGRRIQVPFDQMIVFSTNLEPKQLVDEAFLRRIPYKIEVQDPTVEEFRAIFRDLAERAGIQCPQEMLDYLIEKYYVSQGRCMRFCHPRDLLGQIKNFCSFADQPPTVTQKAIDAAAKTYFAAM